MVGLYDATSMYMACMHCICDGPICYVTTDVTGVEFALNL